ncbi:hypothetical protein T552_02828 [Pneumocystis carinii B80]|uniref:Prefoldin subunit 4 n=1 Tax=Pneumocystis carinii (strain B80) TaxID=1408658 RepID=A0A0W4ZDF4_PNEC8|nr:hypothetical protein T552_02828 [Pneumocystis carinii B80]KTW26343.1 hypothetical protein T552_02828 [Pneumocystis carinii B80]
MMNRMLDRADETDAEVNWEDQCKINTFSKLNQRLQYRKGYLKEKKLEKESIEDITEELELMDGGSFFYKIGDAFVMLPMEEVEERLEKNLSEVDKNVEELEKEISELDCSMEELKSDLYKKFGKAINLET